MADNALEVQLQGLERDLKTLVDQAREQKTNLGAIEKTLADKIDAVQKQADAIDLKMQKAVIDKHNPGLSEQILNSPEIKELITKKRGRARIDLEGKAIYDLLEYKTTTASGLGTATPGVMQFEMDGGIVAMPQPALRMRSVIPARPTSLMRVAWLKESVRPTKASPVAESGLKPLTDLTVTTDYEDVKKIAILLRASDEVLSDNVELGGFIRSELAAVVREEEDLQILSGAGTGDNLNGLTTQAQAWDLTLLTASDGYEYHDIIAGARKQIAGDNELSANPFCVLNELDWWKIMMAKDSTGRYLFQDPAGGVLRNLWGCTLVPTQQITVGYFLVGSGDARAAEIRDRMGLTIDISTEDEDNFKYNRVTFRVECRLALVVKRPNAFVYGAFTQSPA